MIKINNIFNAIRILKSGKTLFSNDENKTFYNFKGGLVHIKGDNSSFSLSEFEFLDLYKEKVFFFEEEIESCEIDDKKDSEYYSISGLKH